MIQNFLQLILRVSEKISNQSNILRKTTLTMEWIQSTYKSIWIKTLLFCIVKIHIHKCYLHLGFPYQNLICWLIQKLNKGFWKELEVDKRKTKIFSFFIYILYMKSSALFFELNLTKNQLLSIQQHFSRRS